MPLASALAIAADAALWVPVGASAAPTDPAAAPTTGLMSGTIALAGSLHPRARPEFDVGRMDPGMRLTGMSLLFRVSPLQKTLQKRALAEVQDPTSPRYHQWLTPEQYAAEFGARLSDIARATAWLTSQGLSVDGPTRTATRLGFGGTIAQIEGAFRTEMHRYRIAGAMHFAMSRAPSVPADLADLVLGLHGMHDFRVRPASQRAQPQYNLPFTETDGGTGSFPVLAPADFAKVYDLDSLYAAGIKGAGQIIAVAEQSDFNDADIAAFRTTFGLPDNPPMRILVPQSGPAAVTGPDDLGEAELDIEWSGAVAPEAIVQSVFTGAASNSDAVDALMYAIEQRIAPVVSTSAGKCEAWFTLADASFLEGYGDMASMEGMTVLAAAGDTGAAACDSQSALAAQYGAAVIFPASVPSFVAVGGSQFQINASNRSTYLDTQLDALSYIPEAAWNETLVDIDAGYGGLGAGGGGTSRLFAKPYWQVPYTPTDAFRSMPDVALSASSDILPYAVSMSWTAADGDAQAPQPQALTAYGGTSVAAPAFAGILALVNQAIAEGSPDASVGLSNANPMLYALANSTASRNAFHDITTGNNVVPCLPGSPSCPLSAPYQFGYAAGPGYDQVTGLGSIDAANLAAAWKTLTPTSTALHVTTSGTVEGSPLQLTATVASKGTVNPMTGSVTFYFVVPVDGGVGLSGTLGASQVAPSATTGVEGATASLTAIAPGGRDGAGVRIGAFYGGDPHYLASWSTLLPVSGTSTLAICPTAVTLAVGQSGFTLTTTGGSPPIHWSIHNDETCIKESAEILCSSIDGGVFTAGPKAGSATVIAIDQDDSYVTAAVTVVAGSPDGGFAPLADASCASLSDSGAGGMADAEGPDGSGQLSPRISGCACSATDVEAHAAGAWTYGVLVIVAAARRSSITARVHGERESRTRTAASQDTCGRALVALAEERGAAEVSRATAAVRSLGLAIPRCGTERDGGGVSLDGLAKEPVRPRSSIRAHGLSVG
jgi:hypothetical protein